MGELTHTKGNLASLYGKPVKPGEHTHNISNLAANSMEVMIPKGEACPPGLIEYISKIDEDLDDIMTRQRLLEPALKQHKQLLRQTSASNNYVDVETSLISDDNGRSGSTNYSGSESQHPTPRQETLRYTPDDTVAQCSSHKFVFTSAYEFLHRFRDQEKLALGEASFLRNELRLL
ncbi:hypothetical protein BGZ58_009313 [Dissophora ornata]|nr:hypothetical protein BGZ58_009313 [Dissophora ornata]